MEDNLTAKQEDFLLEQHREDTCQECGDLWDSEHHISDVCVNLNEDKND